MHIGSREQMGRARSFEFATLFPFGYGFALFFLFVFLARRLRRLSPSF
jgi:hypothetical protein